MSDKQNLTVLRCQLCTKPFNKGKSLVHREIPSETAGLAVSMTSQECTYRSTESTLKRHGYYCRSRNGTARNIRARSCAACVKAKARCNNKLPSCSRCTLKNLDCRVVGRSLTSATQPSHVTGISETVGHRKQDEPSGTPATEAAQLSTTTGTNLTSEDNIFTDFEFADPSEEHVGWDLINIDKPSSSAAHFPDAHQQPHDLTDALTFHNPTNQTGFDVYNSPTSLPDFTSISTMPTYDLRSFTQRSAIKGSATTTAMLMVRILTSYPLMLQDSTCPPPFIHPSFLSNDEDASMESLTTCASLMRMLGSSGHGSKSLLWKNVRLECERLQVQVSHLLPWVD
jgi:hypothetical protein